MKKNYLNFFLSAVALLCCMVASAHDFEVDGIFYNITDESAKTVEVTFKGSNHDDYTEYSGVVVVPETVEYHGYTYTVTAIGDYAFAECPSLRNVFIPHTIKTIDNYAFHSCKLLSSLTIPNSVSWIGNGICYSDAYYYVGQTDYYKYRYAYTLLENVYIGHGVSSIDGSAFNNVYSNTRYNYLTSVYLGCGIKKISGDPFEENNGITSVYSMAITPPDCSGSTLYSNAGVVLYVPYGTKEAYHTSYYWSNFSNIVELDCFVVDGITYKITSDIAATCEVSFAGGSYDQFANEYIGEITIPESVTYLGKKYQVQGVGSSAFNDCWKLTKITLPNSMTYIADSAFYCCTDLYELKLPSSIKNIGVDAFCGAININDIYSSMSVPAEIFSSSFDSLTCVNASLHVMDGTKRMYQESEGWSKFININELDCFEVSGLYYRVLSTENHTCEFVKSLGEYSGDIKIPSFVKYNETSYSVTSIGERALCGATSVVNITIPASVTSIGDFAFSGTGISSITIPSYVTSIGDLVFFACQNLGSIETLVPTPPKITDISFAGIPKNTILDYPTNSDYSSWMSYFSHTTNENQYVEGVCDEELIWTLYNGVLVISGEGCIVSTPWIDYLDTIKIVVIDEGVTAISAYAFSDYVNLNMVSIPSTLTNIYIEAFKNCSGLISVITAATVAPSLGSDAFSGISENAILTVPAGSDYSLWEPYFSTFRGNNSEAITALKVLLANAQVLYNNSVEGDNVGEYVKGSKATLLAVIDELRGVVSDDMLNTEVEDCTAKINAAINTFKSRVNSDYPNSIKLENVAAHAGEQVVVAVNMDNVDEIRGFQFDMFLPTGVTFAVDEDGYELIELSEERASRLHSFRNNIQADGSMRVLCYANSSAVFSGNDGAVLYITLNVAEEMLDGDYVVETRNIALVGSGGVEYNIPLTASSITIESYIMGDVNKDGRVSVSDITTVVDAILYESTDTAYDVNGDSRVSVSDITTVVDIILNEGASAASNAPARVATRSSSNLSLYIDPFEINAGEEKEILVNLSNPGTEITAVEFDLFLPAGLEVVSDEYGYYVLPGSRTPNKRVPHSVSSDLLSSGAIHVICYHNSQLAFTGEDGDVLAITIKAAEDLEPGNYTIDLKNIELVNPADPKNGILISDNNTVVTDIEQIEAEEGTAEIYDLSGRRVNSLVKGIYIVNGKKVVK